LYVSKPIIIQEEITLLWLPFFLVTYNIVSKARRLPLIASCSEMGSRTITAIIISGYSFVTDTLAASTTAAPKFSFVHNVFITLLVFETSEKFR
jgi:hypothetical protein